jgi:hypothetical protein
VAAKLHIFKSWMFSHCCKKSMFNGPWFDSFWDAVFNYVCWIFFITEKKNGYGINLPLPLHFGFKCLLYIIKDLTGHRGSSENINKMKFKNTQVIWYFCCI